MERSLAAGLLAVAMGAAPIWAQTSQDAPPPQTTEKPRQKVAEKPKKVWTNDDLEDLRSTVTITTASATPSAEGAAPAEAPAPGAAPGAQPQLPQEKDPKYYKAKLDPLRKQLADLDAKIKETQGAIDNPYQGTNKISLNQQAPSMPSQGPEPPNRPDDTLYGNQIVRPKDQLAVYQKQRDDIQRQIDDLEAQARNNGIYPGDIR